MNFKKIIKYVLLSQIIVVFMIVLVHAQNKPYIGGSGALQVGGYTIGGGGDNQGNYNVSFGRQSVGGPLPSGGPGMGQPPMGPGGAGIYSGAQNLTESQANLGFFRNLILQAGDIISLLPPILMGLAVVVFFWALIKMMAAQKDGNAENKQKYQKMMMWSLLALFIMTALWGILAFGAEIFGINTNTQATAAQVPMPSLSQPGY